MVFNHFSECSCVTVHRLRRKAVVFNYCTSTLYSVVFVAEEMLAKVDSLRKSNRDIDQERRRVKRLLLCIQD